MVGAGTCADAAACMYFEPLGMNDPRCADAGPNPKDRCTDNGDTILSCAGLYAVHCNSSYYQSGSKCTAGLVGDAGDLGCALGQNCSSGTGCGTYFDYCGVDTLHYAIDCAFWGGACNLTTDAAVACITGNAYMPCSTAGPTCSADTTMVAMCDGSEVSLFDCKALDPKGTCSAKDGPARCVLPTDTCSPFGASVNQCTQTSISLCIGGQPSTFDCSQIGLKCIPAAGSFSAHCG
jgi:hypothetical protein